MTTVISRLYDGAGTAADVAARLMEIGFPQDTISVIGAGKDAAHEIRHARVGEAASATYAGHLTAKRSVLVVRAPFNPIGAARTAIEVVDGHGPLDAGIANENVYLRESPHKTHFLSVMTDHPRFFSSDMIPGSSRKRGRVSDAFGLRLLSQKKRRNSVYSGRKLFMTKSLSTKPRSLSISRRGTIFSSSASMPTLMAHSRG